MAYAAISAKFAVSATASAIAPTHRRTRIEAGLCLPGAARDRARCRSARLCAPCNWTSGTRRRAAPATARLRAEGKPRRDQERTQAKLYERERSRQPARGAQGRRHLHQVRPGPGAPRAHDSANPAPSSSRVAGSRTPRQGEGRGNPVWRTRPRGPAPRRPRSAAAGAARPASAAGLCIRCGQRRAPAEGRTMCEPCREDRRASQSARFNAERRACRPLCVNCTAPDARRQGLLRALRQDPFEERRQRNLESKLRGRSPALCRAKRARGDCTNCGKPANGAAECQACCDAARDRYDRPPGRRGLRQVPDPHLRRHGLLRALRSSPRPIVATARRNTPPSRARYADRRARGRCVECDAPSPGVARCEPCSRRHRESSGAFRGIPIWDPSWTVIEIATGREHGPYRQRGRRRALPRLREARPRPGRAGERREPDEFVYRAPW